MEDGMTPHESALHQAIRIAGWALWPETHPVVVAARSGDLAATAAALRGARSDLGMLVGLADDWLEKAGPILEVIAAEEGRAAA